jgi:class 3 adenylate cyclase
MTPMRRDLPEGMVTFLFTDIEGSTRLLGELGEQTYAKALLKHRRVLRQVFTRHGGVEVDTQGDAFLVAFATAPSAVAAAEEAHKALGRGPIRVRMGLHWPAAPDRRRLCRARPAQGRPHCRGRIRGPDPALKSDARPRPG